MLARKALAGTAGAPKEYVEDVFSTDLFVGNSSSQTVTNNIDLSGDGGLVWLKNRGPGTDSHRLFDTARTLGYNLNTNNALAEAIDSGRDVTAYSSTGYTLNVSDFNTDDTWVSWTFRKAEKFFDVVTYTGDGTQSRAINHSLGSTPGCIIVKCSSTGGTTWFVWHRSINGGNGRLKLASTDAATSPDDGAVWGNSSTSTYVAPTSTTFTVSSNISVNNSGDTYVAYLFAHNAGGFGLAGDQNVISCGSFTTSSYAATVNLGYEPQWLLVKSSANTGNWFVIDNMRGLTNGSGAKFLYPNLSDAETTSGSNAIKLLSTGFSLDVGYSPWNGNSTDTYIYIAIRRGPMKTPTSGTSVYKAITRTGTGAAATVTGVGFASDLLLSLERNAAVGTNGTIYDRLRGLYALEGTVNTQAEKTATDGVVGWDSMDGIRLGTDATRSNINYSSSNYAYQFFKRAPGFFDVVCYTGTGSATTVSHNLGVAPELVILKRRNSAEDWPVLQANIPTQATLNGTFSGDPPNSSYFGNGTSYVAPTSTVFSVGTNSAVNASGGTYVAYLFASLSGVSKVGSYTGNGSSVTVTTDFQPRFILVKRTDSTGDWIVSDSARGLVAGNDPYLELNTADAEVTNEDWVDISSTSFTVNQTTNNANVNTGTYIYLAIA